MEGMGRRGRGERGGGREGKRGTLQFEVKSRNGVGIMGAMTRRRKNHAHQMRGSQAAQHVARLGGGRERKRNHSCSGELVHDQRGVFHRLKEKRKKGIHTKMIERARERRDGEVYPTGGKLATIG